MIEEKREKGVRPHFESRKGESLANDVAAAAQFACLLEVSAAKPGNVSPGQHFVDTRYEDFLASAAAIGAPLAAAGQQPLGRTIRATVEATSRWTASNTNLGIVLLLAPLACAAIREAARSTEGGEPWSAATLRGSLRELIEATTVEDACDVYAAIRQARPGGLGRTDAEDVAKEPTLTLAGAMRLAADRDGIAREYSTGFATTFEVGAAALRRARGDGLPWDDAVIETYVTLLATSPDTHIARRSGNDRAEEVLLLARAVADAGGVRSTAGRQALVDMDRALRDDRHSANPGTTADLTAAAIFVELLTGDHFLNERNDD